MQSPTVTPKVQIAGGLDRDARNIPYDFGNRAARRQINRELDRAARAAARRAAKTDRKV